MRPTALALLLAVPLAAPAADTKPDPVKTAPKVLKPAEAGVGRLVPDVAFTDLAGKPGQLSDFKGSKLTAVVFTNTTCPVCKKYAPALARLEKEYAARGVAFLFVNPTEKAVADHGFAGRYVADADGKLTAALGATSTAEVFVLDASRTVVYRGAVDDQYGLGYSLDTPKARYLVPALDEFLAGKVPAVTATTAPGCALEPDAAKAPAVPLTYHARVERIIQANCVECHRAGGVGPFGLDTYDGVVAQKGMIKKVVDKGTMPPWFAAPGKDNGHATFSNDRSLTPADKKDLLAWLGGDLKKGDPADAPIPRDYGSGWGIGKPDAVFQLPEPIAVKAEGTMPYRNVRVETDYAEDRWVRALEVRPTAREVVHHVLVFALPKGGRNPVTEAMGFFAAYVPGSTGLVYPDGYAKKLPKGSTLLFQIHYTPNGKATADQTRIGLVFAKDAPRHEVHVTGIANPALRIPAGEGNHPVTARIPVPVDARVLALFPHAHLRGKAARFELTTPDKKTETILDVPHYDFNWQLQYRFADPVVAAKGSSLTYTAWYDNSEKNPANPDPKKVVRWGQQTYDEMHLGYVEYVVDGGGGGRLGGLALGSRPADFKFPKGGVEIPAQAKGVFQKYDTNNDGRLDEKEFEGLPELLKNVVLEFAYRTMPPTP